MNINQETLEASQKVYEIEEHLIKDLTWSFDKLPQISNKTIVNVWHKTSGMTAVAYKDNQTDQIIIAYCGTNAIDDRRADFITDLSIMTGIVPAQIPDAIAFYNEVKKANPNSEIVLTGHSLGGGLANEVNVFAKGANMSITYNPAPLTKVSRMKVQSLNVKKFRNYNTKKDPLTKAGMALGLLTGVTYPNGLITIADGGHELDCFFKVRSEVKCYYHEIAETFEQDVRDIEKNKE